MLLKVLFNLLVLCLMSKNINSIKVQINQLTQNNNEWEINFKIFKDDTEYQFIIEDYPADWQITVQNHLLIPISQLQNFSQNFIKITYEQQMQFQIQVILEVIFTEQFLLMNSYDNFKFQSLEEIYQIRQSNKEYLLTNISAVLQESKLNQQDLLAIIIPKNVGLPSHPRLQLQIKRNELIVILRIIKELVNNPSINCSLKFAYLSQIQGKLNQHYINNLKQLQEVSSTFAPILDQQIQIEGVLQYWENLYQDLKLQQNNENLLKKYQQLSNIYLQQQIYTLNIPDLNKRLQKLTKKRSQLTQFLQNIQKDVNDLKIKSEDQSLPPQIIRRNEAEYIKVKEQQFDKFTQLKEYLIEIQALTYYKQVNETMLKKLSIPSIQLETQIQTLERQIRVLERRAAQIQKALQKYQSNLLLVIDFQAQLKEIAINTQLRILRKNIPIINKLSQFIRLLCYVGGFISPQIQTNQIGYFSYILNFEDFQRYFKNLFGGISLAKTDMETIKINRINIFTQKWKQQYGEKTLNLTLQDDRIFCLIVNLEVFSGIVIDIYDKLIIVQTFYGVKYLMISSCTIMYHLKQSIPQKNNLIIWKGSKISNNIYSTVVILTV